MMEPAPGQERPVPGRNHNQGGTVAEIGIDEKKPDSKPWMWLIVLLVLALGAWLFMQRRGGDATMTAPPPADSAVVDTIGGTGATKQ